MTTDTTRKTRLATALAISLFLAGSAYAHNVIPGPVQEQPILLTNGDLQTVSNGLLESTDILLEGGLIAEIGPKLTAPEDARVINISGRIVYPGLIAANTSLGLTEINAVRATSDLNERGLDNGEILAYNAYNWDSEIIPTVRSNGVTTALVVPGGRLIQGRSSLMNLDGWTAEDAVEQKSVGVHLSWPSVRIVDAWWMDKSAEEQKNDQAEEQARLRKIFDKARSYYNARQANPDLPADVRWEGLVPMFERRMPLIVAADDFRQIEQAVAFADEYDLRLIISGGREAYKAAEMLRSRRIPVIFGPVQRLPMRSDDDYDLEYKIPRLLHEAGVTFCFSSGHRSTSVRNLPLQAGQAVAFGLPYPVALRGLTLTTAEILGVADRLGSLEVGKKATLIVSEGDILDPLNHRVILEFIEGRQVDLDSKQKQLYEKYRAR